MTHNYPKATKVCIWYRELKEGEPKQWGITPMEPTWWAVVGWASYPLNDGDEIVLNEDCTIDFSGRVIIKDGVHILVQYSTPEDVKVKIRRI